jgi:hypothetical protein
MAIKDLLIKIGVIGSEKAERKIKGLTSSFSSMTKAAAKGAAVFFAAKGIISGVTRLSELAGRVEGVEKGFNNLNKAVGFSEKTLSKLTKATDGTMKSMDLMQQANNAMLLGVVDSEDQMAEMFDTAQRLASALGQDTAFGIESLVTGLGRQSKLMLDNLGIMVDTDTAYKNYADSIGKSVDKLDDQEKKQAFINEALNSAKELVNDLGEETITTRDKTLQFEKATDDLAVALGKKLNPTVNKLKSALADIAVSLTTILEDDVEFIGAPLSESQLAFKKFREEVEGMSLAQLFIEMEKLGAVSKNTFNQEKQQLYSHQMTVIHQQILAMTKDIKRSGEVEIDFGERIEKINIKNILLHNKIAQAKREQLIKDLKNAALQQSSAKDAMKAVIRSITMETVARAIASAFKSVPYPFNFIAAAGAGGAAAALLDKALSKFADGGIVQGNPSSGDSVPAMLTPGEVILNQAQQENLIGGMGTTINIQGGIVDESYVNNQLIPALNKATSLGTRLNA